MRLIQAGMEWRTNGQSERKRELVAGCDRSDIEGYWCDEPPCRDETRRKRKKRKKKRKKKLLQLVQAQLTVASLSQLDSLQVPSHPTRLFPSFPAGSGSGSVTGSGLDSSVSY